MFGEEKNLKDSSANNLGITIKDTSLLISYTKTNKLVTALYMVTDIIDKDEPLRNKLRTLGIGIISDMYLIKQDHVGHVASLILEKVQEIMSFLDIASAINIISEMNCNILRKEFSELNQSIKESTNTNKAEVLNGQINLAEFFKDSKEEELPLPNLPLYRGRNKEGVLSFRGELNPKGHTRIGVQKGSTLLKALSDKTRFMSKNNLASYEAEGFRSGFDILKKQRRDEIISFITKNKGNATITDIRSGAAGLPADRQGALVSCSEKTLQRELVSMVKDGVLNKTGEKRWSRYFIK